MNYAGPWGTVYFNREHQPADSSTSTTTLVTPVTTAQYAGKAQMVWYTVTTWPSEAHSQISDRGKLEWDFQEFLRLEIMQLNHVA